jgi:alkylation response protein AidB-like acyl-CoA dehydrogenase
VFAHGSHEQRAALLPDILGGHQLGAWALSEAQAGSDVAAIATRAVHDDDGYLLNGTKAWVSQGGVADFYIVFARTSPDPKKGLSTFYLPGDLEGLSFAAPEKKMGLSGSPTCQVTFDDVRVPATWRIGPEGDGMKIALAALDSGRLGIAACATGVAQAALDVAVQYATEREQFHRTIGEFQGVQFLLADMAASVESSRATYLLAARMRDVGRQFSRQASIAKLVCTDAAMKVTTDAVQVLGGYGYTRDFPVERYMREAKVTQIFEGTNQIQRMVIGRALLRRAAG